MPECIHETGAAACRACTPRQAVPATRRPEDGWDPWRAAPYGGHCSGCETRIRSGDKIRPDGSGGWLCAGCGNLGSVYPHVVRVAGGLL